jgi:hypothetical protein
LRAGQGGDLRGAHALHNLRASGRTIPAYEVKINLTIANKALQAQAPKAVTFQVVAQQLHLRGRHGHL